jgi:hypothetical protein
MGIFSRFSLLFLFLGLFLPVIANPEDTALTVADSVVIMSPKILTKSSLSSQKIKTGIPFELTLEAEWQEVPYLILADAHLKISGDQIKVLNKTATQVKELRQGKAFQTFKVIYTLLSDSAGAFKVDKASFSFRSPVPIASQSLRLDPIEITAPTPYLYYVLALVFLLSLTLVFVLLNFRKKQRARGEQSQAEDFGAALRLFGKRIGVVDSREWLLELEALVQRYQKQNEDPVLQTDPAGKQNFSQDELQRYEDYMMLEKDFAFARFAGGKRAPYQNKETLRRAYRCLKIEKEEI